MTRGICVISEEETRKGPWSVQEDVRLIRSIISHGGRRWNRLAEASGLNRSGKSCRLRWLNYLRPGLKHGRMTPDEERLIFELHTRWGNRWSRIARRLPGRTDNEIKNYWRTHIKKKLEFNPPDHGLCSSFHNISNRALAKLNLTSSASTISVPSDLEKAVSPSSSTFQITPDIRVRRDGNSSPEIRIIEDVKRDYEFEFQQGVCDTCSDREISDGCRPSALHDILLMNTLSYDFSSSEEDSLQRLELKEDGQENSSTFFLDGTEDLLKEDQSFWHYYSDVLWNLDDGGRHLVHPQL